MAIKGKKKSQSRGSQARRRPAAMPRPVVAARKPKWYQTTAGLSIASIGGIILLIFAAWVFTVMRSNARDEKALSDGLESYTGSIKATLVLVTPAATDMAGAASSDPKTVAKDAAGWLSTLQGAQTQLTAVVPLADAETANLLLQQSLAGFITAARTMELAADLPDEAATKLITTTLAQVSTASALWDTGVGLLDQLRAEAGLGSSGLRSPTAVDPSVQPTPSVTLPPADSGAGGGGNGGGGGKRDKKNGGGNG